MLMLRKRGKQIKQGKKNENLGERGDIGQFWKATRTRLGEPQLYRVPFALNIERKGNADLMVTALDLTPRRIPLITFIFSSLVPDNPFFFLFKLTGSPLRSFTVIS